jgi:hypothetical protein
MSTTKLASVKCDDDKDGKGTMRNNSSVLPIAELKHRFGF